MRFIHRTGPPVTVSNRPEPPTHRQPKTRLVGLGRSPVRFKHANLTGNTDGGTPWPDRRLPVPLIVALIGKHATDTAPAWAKTVGVTPATLKLRSIAGSTVDHGLQGLSNLCQPIAQSDDHVIAVWLPF